MENTRDKFIITEAEGDENGGEVTEITIKSTGDRIRKGDTVFNKYDLKPIRDVYFDRHLSHNLIKGKRNNKYYSEHLNNVVISLKDRFNQWNDKKYTPERLDIEFSDINEHIEKLWEDIGSIWSIIKKDTLFSSDDLQKLNKKTSPDDDHTNFAQSTKKIFEERCYFIHDVNGDEKFVTLDREYAYKLYNSGGHVLKEYPIINPKK